MALAGFAGGAGAALVIKILTDASAAQKDLDKTSGKVGKMQGALGAMAGPATVALGAVTLFGAGAAKAASDVEQSFGALESVFGKQAGAAKRLAADAAESTGLAAADYAQMAAVLGAQLKNMGVAEKDILPTTKALIEQGADMAATFGGPTADAVNAISSLLRGERDPIERYGVSIKEATLEADIGADKLKKMTDAQQLQAKTTASLRLLTLQTADAHGAFAREADTAAGASQRAAASWENSQAAIGEALLPVMLLLAGALSSVAKWMTENKGLVTGLIIGIGALSAAILVANVALGAYAAISAIFTTGTTANAVATGIWTAAQWLLNAALLANPIGLVVLAIAALVGAIILAYKNSETFRKVVDAAFKAVQAVVKSVVDFVVRLFSTLGGILEGPFRAFVRVVVAAGGAASRLWQTFVEFLIRIWSTLTAPLEGPFKALQAIVRTVGGVMREVIGKAVEFVLGLFRGAGAKMAAPFEFLLGIVRTIFGKITKVVEDAVGFIGDLLGGIEGALGGVADWLDTVGKSAPAPAGAVPVAYGVGGAPVAGVSSMGVGRAAPAPVRLSATVTHRIEDPGGALAGLPGGARAVADLLNRGADATGLYRNLQHQAGLR